MALAYACELLADVSDLLCGCDLPVDENQIETVLEGASDFLSQLSAMPLGRCEATYRPVRDCLDACYPCSCCGLRGIHLPGLEPAVTEVKINGAIVPTSEYVVMVEPRQGAYVLERLNGEGRSAWWPRGQILTRAPTLDNTFQIKVTSGMARTQLMTLAAAEIACDVFKYMANIEHLLPDGVVHAIVGGVSIDWRRFSDPTDQDTMDLAGLAWTRRFLLTLPDKPTGTQILSPELDDGWHLYRRL